MSHTAPRTDGSTNRQAEPEVWFRIVHIARQGGNGAALRPAYHEQEVQTALGPKGAFKNSNIGGLAESDPRRIRQRVPGTLMNNRHGRKAGPG
jgi:hypothetical protein